MAEIVKGNALVKPFYYMVIVWGRDHIQSLLQVTLPSLLASKNLPHLSNLSLSRFIFVTTALDWVTISNSEVFKHLSNYILPIFIELPTRQENFTSYHWMSQGYQLATQLAIKNGACCIYLTPDAVVSNGTLVHLENLVRLGKKAVVLPGLRLKKEIFYDEMINHRKEATALNFEARELAVAGLRMLHDEILKYDADSETFTFIPHLVTWHVKGTKELLIRSFHLHPLLLDTTCVNSKSIYFDINQTIDGEFLGRNIANWSDIHVVEDSDNALVFSLTGAKERTVSHYPNKITKELVRAMAYSRVVNPLHRYFFTKTYKLHYHDIDSDWHMLEKKTSEFAYECLSLNEETRVFNKAENLLKGCDELGAKFWLKLLSFILIKKIRTFTKIFDNFIKMITNKFRFSKKVSADLKQVIAEMDPFSGLYADSFTFYFVIKQIIIRSIGVAKKNPVFRTSV